MKTRLQYILQMSVMLNIESSALSERVSRWRDFGRELWKWLLAVVG